MCLKDRANIVRVRGYALNAKVKAAPNAQPKTF